MAVLCVPAAGLADDRPLVAVLDQPVNLPAWAGPSHPRTAVVPRQCQGGHGLRMAAIVRDEAPTALIRSVPVTPCVDQPILAKGVLEGIDRALDDQAAVLSASLGFDPFDYAGLTVPVARSLDRLADSQAVLVIASGNGWRTDPNRWPANHPLADNVIVARPFLPSIGRADGVPPGDDPVRQQRTVLVDTNTAVVLPDGGITARSGSSGAAAALAGMIAQRMAGTGSTAVAAAQSILDTARPVNEHDPARHGRGRVDLDTE